MSNRVGHADTSGKPFSSKAFFLKVQVLCLRYSTGVLGFSCCKAWVSTFKTKSSQYAGIARRGGTIVQLETLIPSRQRVFALV